NATDPSGLQTNGWPNIHVTGPGAGTPTGPIGDGFAISIFGERDNPNYEDYSSDPEYDEYRSPNGVIIRRPNTSTLGNNCVSDISIRSARLTTHSWQEI